MEEFNKKIESSKEMILKNTAITFSMEGIKSSIKDLIQKKISHNRSSLTQITRMIGSVLRSDQKYLKKNLLNEKDPIRQLFDHVTEEIKTTDIMINVALESLFEEKEILEKKKKEIQNTSNINGSLSDENNEQD